MTQEIISFQSVSFQYDSQQEPTLKNLNFSIKKGEKVYLQAGAGIVADSVPENEYQECCNKVMALAKTLVEEEKL